MKHANSILVFCIFLPDCQMRSTSFLYNVELYRFKVGASSDTVYTDRRTGRCNVGCCSSHSHTEHSYRCTHRSQQLTMHILLGSENSTTLNLIASNIRWNSVRVVINNRGSGGQTDEWVVNIRTRLSTVDPVPSDSTVARTSSGVDPHRFTTYHSVRVFHYELLKRIINALVTDDRKCWVLHDTKLPRLVPGHHRTARVETFVYRVTSRHLGWANQRDRCVPCNDRWITFNNRKCRTDGRHDMRPFLSGSCST